MAESRPSTVREAIRWVEDRAMEGDLRVQIVHSRSAVRRTQEAQDVTSRTVRSESGRRSLVESELQRPADFPFLKPSSQHRSLPDQHPDALRRGFSQVWEYDLKKEVVRVQIAFQ